MTLPMVGKLSVGSAFPNVEELIKRINDFIAAFAKFKGAFGGIEAQLDALLDVLATLEGVLDFSMNAFLPFKVNAMLEFQGALKAIANLTIAISNPLGQAIAAIAAMAQATASLKASLNLGLPTISADLNMQLSAVAAVAAAAKAKMISIQAIIDALLSAFGPMINGKLVIDGIKAQLTAVIAPMDISLDLVTELSGKFDFPSGGVYLYSGSGTYSDFSTLLGPAPSGMTEATPVKAIVMLVDPLSNPSTWASLQFMVKTTP